MQQESGGILTREGSILEVIAAKLAPNVKGNIKPPDFESEPFDDLLLPDAAANNEAPTSCMDEVFFTRFEPAVVETFHTSYKKSHVNVFVLIRLSIYRR